MKTFVGIIILTKLTLNNQEELVAILQRRGKFNTEDPSGFKLQSFAGLCEATAYGQAHLGEEPLMALKREMTEELGPVATDTIFATSPTPLFTQTEPDQDQIYLWSAFCDKSILEQIKLEVSTGGLEIVREADLPHLEYVTFGPTKVTCTDLNQIIAFELPTEALAKAFALYK